MKTNIFIAILVICSVGVYAQQSDNAVAASGETTVAPVTDKHEERFSFSRDGLIEESLNERKLYSGNVRKKRLHGNWESWYQNGQLCDSGKLESGLPDGTWKHWDENGQLIAVRTYSSDKYNRIKLELTRHNPRHTVYPLTVMYHKNKTAASKYLHSSYSFPQSIRRIDDQSLQRWVAANVSSGNVYHPVFDQSLHHGLFINYFPDGIAKDSGYYQNGLRQGVWVHRQFADGLYYTGAYKNGNKIREWRAYMPSGKIMGIIFYNDKGQEQSRRRFDQ